MFRIIDCFILKFSFAKCLKLSSTFVSAQSEDIFFVIQFRLCISVSSRYGFRDNPMLFVTARPKLGARQVKLTHVTDWIERKLKQEFKVKLQLTVVPPV